MSDDSRFGCVHGRPVGQPCPHCMGINDAPALDRPRGYSPLLAMVALRDLVARLPNDADLGAAVRAIVTGGGE